MKNIISTSLRHIFTALAGLGTFLAMHGLIGPSDGAAVDVAGATLGDALAVVAAALVARLVVWATGMVVTGGVPNVPLWMLSWLCVGTLVAGGLPACSPAQMEAARAIPIRIGIQGPDGAATYSSKGGLQFHAIVRDSGK
jgi:hypothetical protein